jgi:hypothetical protein
VWIILLSTQMKALHVPPAFRWFHWMEARTRLAAQLNSDSQAGSGHRSDIAAAPQKKKSQPSSTGDWTH